MGLSTMSFQNISDQALTLNTLERVALIEQLLLSLDQPDISIDALIASQVEQRINAYEAGQMHAISAEHVFEKLTKN